MILRNCSPARQNDARLYGGPGGASSAEEAKRGATSPHPSAGTWRAQLAAPLKVAPGTHLGGNRGGTRRSWGKRPPTLGHIVGTPSALGLFGTERWGAVFLAPPPGLSKTA